MDTFMQTFRALEQDTEGDEKKNFSGQERGFSSNKEGTDLPSKDWPTDSNKLKGGDTLVDHNDSTVTVRSGETAKGEQLTGRAFLYPAQLGAELKPGQTYSITGNVDVSKGDQSKLSINFYDSKGREIPAQIKFNADGTFTATVTIPKGFSATKISLENYKGANESTATFSNLKLQGGSVEPSHKEISKAAKEIGNIVV